jgi:lipoate-protein ligase A
MRKQREAQTKIEFMPLTKEYHLPDLDIMQQEGDFLYTTWTPDKTYIILGRSNQAETSLHLESVEKDDLVVMKRPSGGETVILSPKTLVIAVKMKAQNPGKPHPYFHIVNDTIMKALSNFGVKGLNSKGISDISLGEIKILGSSMFREQDILFYHAVLNISEDPSLFEKYLKHPKREPDYRKGRSHKAFVTSLQAEGYLLSHAQLETAIKEELEKLQPWDR